MRFEGAVGGVNRLKGGIFIDIGGESGRRGCELVAAVFELKIASEIIFFAFDELFSAVRLIKPNNADDVRIVTDDAFGDGEITTTGTASYKAVDFAFDNNGTWFDVGNFGGSLKIFVVAR